MADILVVPDKPEIEVVEVTMLLLRLNPRLRERKCVHRACAIGVPIVTKIPIIKMSDNIRFIMILLLVKNVSILF
jgi:hypothetical protein